MSAEAGPSRIRTSPSLAMLEHAQLIKQGAEARVYSLPSLFPQPTSSSSNPSPAGPPVILKYRFPKTYRHPTLDASLTKTRISFEARALARCLKAGISVPRVMFVDERNGVLGIEKIEGWSIREVLGGGAEGEEEGQGEEGEYVDPAEAKEVVKELDEVVSEGMEALGRIGVTKVLDIADLSEDLMASIGTILAKLHATTIIHGDLTTSNMMLRLTPNSPSGQPYEIVLIDFGLSSTAQYAENYAVDLYVLERAFASTHPASEGLYKGVLEAYAKGLGEKRWKPIETKLKEVRLRGRKRDMTG